MWALNNLIGDRMKKADEILKKYEDLNEYHFYEIDRNWIIAAMEEYKNIPLDKPVKPEIAEDFKLLKELAEGELLAYDIYPPKDEVQKIHKERWEEALKNVKKYFR